MNKKLRKRLIFLAKLLVAAGLLALVLRKVRWHDYQVVADGQATTVRGFLTTVQQADPYLLAGAMACFMLPILILAIRWWYLLRIPGIYISVTEAVRLTFLGTFFNYVVPGTVSGDLVKAYYVSRHTDRKAAVLVSVVVDRAIGLLEFAILPAVVIIVLYAAGRGRADRLAVPALVVAGVLVCVTAGLAALLSPRFRRFFRLRYILSRLPLQKHVAMAATAADTYRRRPAAMARAMGVTFVGQTIFVVGVMLSSMSLGLGIAWYRFFLYIPLIYIIAAVPISPGGLGLAEAFYMTFLATDGVSASEVLVLALVARLLPMICSLPGVVVAMTGPRLPRAEQIQAELAE